MLPVEAQLVCPGHRAESRRPAASGRAGHRTSPGAASASRGKSSSPINGRTPPPVGDSGRHHRRQRGSDKGAGPRPAWFQRFRPQLGRGMERDQGRVSQALEGVARVGSAVAGPDYSPGEPRSTNRGCQLFGAGHGPPRHRANSRRGLNRTDGVRQQIPEPMRGRPVEARHVNPVARARVEGHRVARPAAPSAGGRDHDEETTNHRPQPQVPRKQWGPGSKPEPIPSPKAREDVCGTHGSRSATSRTSTSIM